MEICRLPAGENLSDTAKTSGASVYNESCVLGKEPIMMTMTLRMILILASVATFFQMMRRIRQSKVEIESAIFWIVWAWVLIVFSICPPVADFIAHCLGIYSTANFLFLFAIFLLIVKVFYMTIHISQLETKIKELVQVMAIREKEQEERERSCGEIMDREGNGKN